MFGVSEMERAATIGKNCRFGGRRWNVCARQSIVYATFRKRHGDSWPGSCAFSQKVLLALAASELTARFFDEHRRRAPNCPCDDIRCTSFS